MLDDETLVEVDIQFGADYDAWEALGIYRLDHLGGLIADVIGHQWEDGTFRLHYHFLTDDERRDYEAAMSGEDDEPPYLPWNGDA